MTRVGNQQGVQNQQMQRAGSNVRTESHRGGRTWKSVISAPLRSLVRLIIRVFTSSRAGNVNTLPLQSLSRKTVSQGGGSPQETKTENASEEVLPKVTRSAGDRFKFIKREFEGQKTDSGKEAVQKSFNKIMQDLNVQQEINDNAQTGLAYFDTFLTVMDSKEDLTTIKPVFEKYIADHSDQIDADPSLSSLADDLKSKIQ